MRLLITRPKEDARPLVKLLEGAGHSCVLLPLLDIVFEEGATNLLGTYKVKDVQALIVTSANGVRAFAQADKRRSFKVMAVGDASARAARDAGFKSVESAKGDVETLAALIKEKCNPEKGQLLHIAGSRVAGDLKTLLEKDGFGYERVVLYRADRLEHLSPVVEKEIQENKIDGVLLYSPRTGAAFVALLVKSNLKKYAKNMVAYGLSAAVGSKIKDCMWKKIIIAPTPDQDALLACIKETKDETMTIPKKDDVKKSDTKASDKKTDPKVIDVKAETVKVETLKKPAPTEIKKPADKPKPQPDPVEKALKDKAQIKVKKKGSFKTKLLLAGFVIIAGAGAGAYFTQDIWVPKAKAKIVDLLGLQDTLPSASQTDPRIAGLIQRLEAVEARKHQQPVDIAPLMSEVQGLSSALDDVKTQVSTIKISNGDSEKLEEFQKLAARLEGISTTGGQDYSALQQENAHLSQLLNELNNRLTDIEAARVIQRSAGDNVQALVSALSGLREVVRTSASYEAELQVLGALAQGDTIIEQAIEGLRGQAGQGISSRNSLLVQFDRVANDIVRAVAIPEGAGWIEQTVKNVTSLVKIRRAPGQTAGEGPLGIVARAEENLRAGDLAASLSELEMLQGKPKEAAQDWLTQAGARLNAEQTLSQLQAHILSLLGTQGGQG